MEGGVVERDRAVIEGIAVDPTEKPEVPETGTAIEAKEELPPKVAPGDQPPAEGANKQDL